MDGLNNLTLDIIRSNYLYTQLSSIIPQPYLDLLLFTIGMFIYAVFVWHFYRKLAKRDIFELNLQKYNIPGDKYANLKKVGSVFLYILEYGIIFPVYTFFWFSVFSLFLLILGKNISVEQIILVSITFVSTIRVTSYYKEDLSNDLAKLLPLAMLAILLTDPSFFSMELLTERLTKTTELWTRILQFMVFTILLEWTLRILYSIKQSIRTKPKNTNSHTKND